MKTQNNNNLPKGWRKVKLGEVAGVLGGFAFKSSWFNKQRIGYPVIKIQNLGQDGFIDTQNIEYVDIDLVNKNISKFKVGYNDFFVAMTGATAGKIAVLKDKNKDYYLNQRVGKFYIKDTNKLDFKYLYYSIFMPKNKIVLRQLADGSAQGNMSTGQIEELLEINLPPLDEQKRIAEILSVFDDKIELNNKIIKTLEEMAQEVFKEWFSENSKFKSQRSKLWETIKISDLTWIISGYPFSSKLYNKSKKGLGVVTIKNVQDGNFITECDSFIEEKKIPKNMSQECLISDGDILLSLTGNVGRVCFVYGGKYLLNQRVAKLKPKNPNDLAFIYFLFRQPNMQNLLVNMAKGSAQPNLSPVETGEIEITIPTREILDKLNKVINPMYEKLIKLKVENQKLSELRDLLLPKLMNGEIRV
jgi:type I restriction enzyme S subunit